jgi:hypothetical protein
MFPGFKYAGKPIGLGIRPIFNTIWKFFMASVMAGICTKLIVGIMPYFLAGSETRDAFARMVIVSMLFCALYLAGVMALHRGLGPLRESLGIVRDLLPERMLPRSFTAANEVEEVSACDA